MSLLQELQIRRAELSDLVDHHKYKIEDAIERMDELDKAISALAPATPSALAPAVEKPADDTLYTGEFGDEQGDEPGGVIDPDQYNATLEDIATTLTDSLDHPAESEEQPDAEEPEQLIVDAAEGKVDPLPGFDEADEGSDAFGDEAEIVVGEPWEMTKADTELSAAIFETTSITEDPELQAAVARAEATLAQEAAETPAYVGLQDADLDAEFEAMRRREAREKAEPRKFSIFGIGRKLEDA